MNTPRLQRHAAPWVLSLVLALVWLGGWGQVHRVLHPSTQTVVQTVTSAEALAKASATGLAHEDGSSLCQLLDQLSHGSGPVMAPWLALPSAAPLAPPIARADAPPSIGIQAFEARGPPRQS